MSTADVQVGNQAWWTTHTMSYDWKDKVQLPRFSPAWFDEIDRRFIHGARLYATRDRPFDLLIPFESLAGKRVLEIGCGMGLHAELMARAGAQVTAVDLSPTSVEATQKRFELKGLVATVARLDAEDLPFDRDSFDFVWSWGVIHHSSRTARIVRHINRVLSPGGEARVMVYNRESALTPIRYVRDYLLNGAFRHRSFDEVLYRSTDGFSARFYVPEHFGDLFRAFFDDVDVQICGQDVDALPLPHRARQLALRFVSEAWLRRRQARWGSFIFVRARHPIP